jgi:hypothetical protein
MKVFDPDLPGLNTKIFLKRMFNPKTKSIGIVKDTPRDFHSLFFVPEASTQSNI